MLGYVTLSMLMANLKWARPRAKTAIDDLMSQSMLWVDCQEAEWEYWSPGVITEVGEWDGN